MFCVIGLFAAKQMLGFYFNILYYIVYPAVIYLIAVGFNAISQQGTCNSVTNITNCFTGAAYTLGYLYATMVAVNLIGPNGILTFEPEEAPIIKMSQSAPPPLPKGSDEIPPKSQGMNMTKMGVSGTTQNDPQKVPGTPISSAVSNNSTLGDPTNPQGGGKRILRQRGGDPSKDTMSDAALMIRSFFTTLRAPAMSLFIRDPNAATLEDVETKSPLYTGIGVGFWACLATISGQVISSSIAQVC